MTGATRKVRIAHTPTAADRYGAGWAVVGVDVFRATTLLCTAAALGRRCFVAGDLDEAAALMADVPTALLGGERSGQVPPEFDLGNSPAAIAGRGDVDRPLVLTTSSGTPLLRRAATADAVYAACLRNVSAQAAELRSMPLDVVLIGAGTGGQRRREDDLGCARIAAELAAGGYQADAATTAFIEQHAHRPVEWCAHGRSADFLRRTGRQDDIDFVLSHQDDLDMVFEVCGVEVVARALEPR